MYLLLISKAFAYHCLLPPLAQGTILIAVNPLRRVPNPEMNEFIDHPLNPGAPHPYAIAEVCFAICVFYLVLLRDLLKQELSRKVPFYSTAFVAAWQKVPPAADDAEESQE